MNQTAVFPYLNCRMNLHGKLGVKRIAETLLAPILLVMELGFM